MHSSGLGALPLASGNSFELGHMIPVIDTPITYHTLLYEETARLIDKILGVGLPLELGASSTQGECHAHYSMPTKSGGVNEQACKAKRRQTPGKHIKRFSGRGENQREEATRARNVD